MATRTRTQTQVVVGPGTADQLSTGQHSATAGAYSTSECTDTVDGTRRPHALTIVRTCPARYVINGSNKNSSSFRWDYSNYLILGAPQGHLAPVTVEPSNNTVLSSTLARTNPSRPHVDVPGFIYELKDIPDLVMDKWNAIMKGPSRNYLFGQARRKADIRRLPKDVAEDYLEWQFAIAPLISDVAKMLRFVQATEKKLKMLTRLQEGGSAGGYAVVWEDWAEGPLQTAPLSGLYQEFRQVKFNVGTSHRKWGTCVWIPTVPLPPKTHQESLDLALRLTFGLDVSFATMWNVMPWSWMIDWFSNVGDIFDGNRNTIPVRHDGSCVMLHKKTKLTNLAMVPHASAGNCYVRDIGFLRESKQRFVVGSASPIPEFGLPFLSGKQLGILASLTVTKKVPIS